MLRGNHECRQLATYFNFKKEVTKKYDLTVFNAFMDSFNTLPLACVLNQRFFIVHAGISPSLQIVLT